LDAPVATGFDFNPWQSSAIMGGMLLVLASAGVILVRFKNRGLFPASRQEKLMEIVGTLALAPKRSVILVRIKGEEFALASTEHGISFLKSIGETGVVTSNATTPSFSQARETLSARLGQTSKSFDVPVPARPRAIASPDASAAAIASTAHSAPALTKVGTSEDEAAALARGTGSKSDLLLSALRNIRGKAAPEPVAERSEPKPGRAQIEKPEPTPKVEAAKGNAFPRYLANAFAEEGKREIKKQRPDARTEAAATEEHQVESVTSLIREKLRDMKPLA